MNFVSPTQNPLKMPIPSKATRIAIVSIKTAGTRESFIVKIGCGA